MKTGIRWRRLTRPAQRPHRSRLLPTWICSFSLLLKCITGCVSCLRSSWHKGKEAQGKAGAGTTAPDCTEKSLVKKVSGFGDKGRDEGSKSDLRVAFCDSAGPIFPFCAKLLPPPAGAVANKGGLVANKGQSGRANRLINHCCQDGWRPITDHGKHYACSVGREDQSRVSGGPHPCEPAGATRS